MRSSAVESRAREPPRQAQPLCQREAQAAAPAGRVRRRMCRTFRLRPPSRNSIGVARTPPNVLCWSRTCVRTQRQALRAARGGAARRHLAGERSSVGRGCSREAPRGTRVRSADRLYRRMLVISDRGQVAVDCAALALPQASPATKKRRALVIRAPRGRVIQVRLARTARSTRLAAQGKASRTVLAKRKLRVRTVPALVPVSAGWAKAERRVQWRLLPKKTAKVRRPGRWRTTKVRTISAAAVAKAATRNR